MDESSLKSDTETLEVTIEVKENPFVQVVTINGKKYNQIFDPKTQTTRVELLVG